MMNLPQYPISMFGLKLHHMVRIVEAWVGCLLTCFGGNFGLWEKSHELLLFLITF